MKETGSVKKLVALLVCCVLLAPTFVGILADEALLELEPVSESVQDSAQPRLRLRSSVNEEKQLTVRGTFYLNTSSEPVNTYDRLELTVVVFNAAAVQVRSETVTVNEGRFSARFAGLQDGTYSARVFSGERSIGRIRRIHIGVAPEQVSEPTQRPTARPTPQPVIMPAPAPVVEPAAESLPEQTPEPESTGDEGSGNGEPKSEGGGSTEVEPETESESEDKEAEGMPTMPTVFGLTGDSLGEEPLGFVDASLAFEPFSLGTLALTAKQQGELRKIEYTVTGVENTTVHVTLTPGGAVPPPDATITLPAGVTTSGPRVLDVPAFGVYTITAKYDDDSDTASVVAAVAPPLAVDPISDASPVVAGLTAPGLQVEVTTVFGNVSTTVKTQANFRGAFYAALPRLQKAGMDVWISVLYPGGTVTERVSVQRARDLATYPNNLSLGQQGPGVLAMQQRLKDLGYDVDVNSRFDAKTLKAVLDFQRINFIVQDGIAGPVTRSLLFSVTAREYTTAAVGSAGVLKYGDQGQEVRALQVALRTLGYYTGSLNGIFGNGTRSAVRAFERRNGLPVDGIADLVMQAWLYSGAALRAGSSSSSGSGSRATPRPTSTPAGWDAPVVTPTPPEPDPEPQEVVQEAINEMPVSAAMRFGMPDTVAQKILGQGTLRQGMLRVEAEAAYRLLDMGTPGMLLRASYVDMGGNVIPSRIQFTATVGNFIARDDQRSTIALYSSPYIADNGEAYWSLTPYFQAMERGGDAPEPAIGRDMIYWLDRPLMDAEPGRQWRVIVEVMDLQGSMMWLESAELVMTLQEDGMVTLDTDALMNEGWLVSALSLGW
ncbi:MAG: peptidoglycan-binding protein [Clostridia bacterium]|nr:peptidoglycan-binding protein [Clostridia bacterium]